MWFSFTRCYYSVGLFPFSPFRSRPPHLCFVFPPWFVLLPRLVFLTFRAMGNDVVELLLPGEDALFYCFGFLRLFLFFGPATGKKNPPFRVGPFANRKFVRSA